MNADRRKQIEKAIGMIAEARALIETAAAEERDYYDNMPESFQQGEKGEKADGAATALEEAQSSLEELENSLPDVIAEG